MILKPSTVNYCDLHAHSTVSDGTMSPEDLAQHAKDQGVHALALTDHDTTGGLSECQSECDRLNIDFVPGIEISCEPATIPEIEASRAALKMAHESAEGPRTYNTDDGLPPLGVLHILGLFIDPENPSLTQINEKMQSSRDGRNPQILQKLRQQGIDITDQDLIALSEQQGVAVLSRPHIGQILMDKGYVSSVDEAFDRFLKRGKPAYVPREMTSMAEAIEAIHDAGGLALLAHPPQLRLGVGEVFYDVLRILKRMGLDGVEVLHPCHTGPQSEKLNRMAEAHDLLKSGGSDFHGYRKKIALGCEQVPYEMYERLKVEVKSKYVVGTSTASSNKDES